jgi:hypothetical protein
MRIAAQTPPKEARLITAIGGGTTKTVGGKNVKN